MKKIVQRRVQNVRETRRVPSRSLLKACFVNIPAAFTLVLVLAAGDDRFVQGHAFPSSSISNRNRTTASPMGREKYLSNVSLNIQ